MKATNLTLIILGITTLGCTSIREKRAEELLERSKMRDEIYSVILNDEDYLSKFMDKMMADEKGKAMITKNHSLMKMMCMSDRMDSLMNKDQQVMKNMANFFVNRLGTDSLMCDHTCARLMENERFKNYFMEHSSLESTEKSKFNSKK